MENVIDTPRRVRAVAPKMVIDRKELADTPRAELTFMKRCSNKETQNDGATYRGKDYRVYLFASELGLNVNDEFQEKVFIAVDKGVISIV